jgi:hypothetical protein
MSRDGIKRTQPESLPHIGARLGGGGTIVRGAVTLVAVLSGEALVMLDARALLRVLEALLDVPHPILDPIEERALLLAILSLTSEQAAARAKEQKHQDQG